MTVSKDGDRVALVGDCHVEEAETLFGVMAEVREVDLTHCRHMHGAVLQVLLSCRPKIVGAPDDPFLAKWVNPTLAALT